MRFNSNPRAQAGGFVFWSLQGADWGGRGPAGLRSNTADDCCRRLRGSGLGIRFPWAYAHGYLLPPLRGSIGIPVLTPGVLFLESSGCGLGWARCGGFESEFHRQLLTPPTRLGGRDIRIHGLTPTATCCRRFAAPLDPVLAPGDQVFFPEETRIHRIDRINRARSRCTRSWLEALRVPGITGQPAPRNNPVNPVYPCKEFMSIRDRRMLDAETERGVGVSGVAAPRAVAAYAARREGHSYPWAYAHG